jgi:23S rRNA (cytidine1920-2'-O)/16S rRNA (cytidine1409-2'-O)-methyltransferase
MATKKRQLADLLVERGDCRSRDEAARWILAGQVYVDGQRAAKPGSPVAIGAGITFKGGRGKFVSRGGLKLEHALREFGVDVAGRTALDAGASVGGFTDCLLQHGASRVYAVDVGFGQIRGKLTADPRVVTLERTNISDLTRERLPWPIDLATLDLSYLSLVNALPIVASLFPERPLIIALIKPLFEGVRAEDKDNLPAIDQALRQLPPALARNGLYIRRITNSPILGSSGTVEFLALVGDEPGNGVDDQRAAAIACASALVPDH